MIALLPLSNGDPAMVDAADLPLVSHIRWRCQPIKRSSGGFYVYGRCPIKRAKVYLHRYLLSAPCGQHVDHVNGDGTDNRRENLRLCSQSENNTNRRDYVTKWGFRGVFWCNQHRKFRGRVRLNGKLHQTAWFKTAVEAARARDALAKQIHGKFAVFNFSEAAQ